ncbi:MAG: hypothetical protein SCM11_05280 [Bacillota bacterium]|nr:hypothetical protein [Bacillota bacterium]
MILRECARILDAGVAVPAPDMDIDIQVACGADLMSDVMAFACTSNELLLTGLVNPQSIRTAEMMDIKVVVFVRGKQPGEAILDLARQKNICVLTTQYPMFSACGLLYQNGVKGKGG